MTNAPLAHLDASGERHATGAVNDLGERPESNGAQGRAD